MTTTQMSAHRADGSGDGLCMSACLSALDAERSRSTLVTRAPGRRR